MIVIFEGLYLISIVTVLVIAICLLQFEDSIQTKRIKSVANKKFLSIRKKRTKQGVLDKKIFNSCVSSVYSYQEDLN